MADLNRILVDDLDSYQPLGRHLLLLFNAFEEELLSRIEGFYDVTAADLEILRSVKPQGSRAVEIAALARMTKQGAGKAIHSLEERGYLNRRTNPNDKRSKIVAFTARGEKLLKEVVRVVELLERRYSLILGGRKLEAMKADLRRLLKDHQGRSHL